VITTLLGLAAIVTWLGFEVVFRQPGESSSTRATETDRGSTWLLIAAYAIAFVLPLALGRLGFGSIGVFAWLGVVLAGIGLVLRAWAMRTLGAAYSRTLRTTTVQSLVTSGPYRWIRHPGYAGSICVWVGAALCFDSWPTALAVAVLMLLAYGWRIRAEERMLADHFGQPYRDYVASSWRLVPGVF
jgi:protein-S-isoprenylcysteine O-methyltransferase Ste14